MISFLNWDDGMVKNVSEEELKKLLGLDDEDFITLEDGIKNTSDFEKKEEWLEIKKVLEKQIDMFENQE